MIKLTLLEIVQSMLTAIEAENVTDVGETEEAGMCVDIANNVYEEIASSKRWVHFRTYSTMSAGSNANELTLPSGVVALDTENLYYSGTLVYYMRPEEFLEYTIGRDTSESNISSVNGVKVYTDRDPVYFTSDDDETLRFDAYDTSALSGSDVTGIVWKVPTSRLSANGDIFDFPAVGHPAIRALSVARAISLLKEDTEEGAKQERSAKALLARLSVLHKLIDPKADARRYITPRRTIRNVRSTHIRYNS